MTQSLTKQEIENSYDIYDVLNKNCMDYARYILKYRCIPSLEDGLKCIHRRSVWSFYKNNLLHNKPRTKSVNACGGVLSYSPHGDASVYGACVRLANDSVLLNLIDGKGNFSSCTSRDVDAGASRYTEMRLHEICTELLRGINKNNVPMVRTYDDARLEPTYLPTSFPLILCNPNIGIGCGFSTSIASFNLSDVIDYTIAKLNNTELPLLCPDFPTGADYIYNKNELNNIHKTGRGKLTLKAKYHFDGDSIVFTGIPYTTTREQVVEKVIDLVKTGVTKDIIDVNDYTGLKGLDITVDLKKNANKDKVLALLFKKTTLQDNFSCNFNVLDNGVLKLYGISAIIDRWLENRVLVIKRELQHDIQQLKSEQVKLQGLSIILNDLDTAIALIRDSNSEKEAMNKLKSHFNLSDTMTDYISSIRMVNMNHEWLTSKISKLTEINKQLEVNEQNLDSEEYYKATIISQLTEIKTKYGQPRRTTIIHQDEVETISNDTLIENFNNQIVLTKEGYFKRTLKYSESQKIKDGDYVIQQLPSTNKSKLLFFTDKANCYYLNAYDMSPVQPSVLGAYLPTLLQLQDENIIHVVSTEDFNGFMLFAFENGRVAKINLSSYATKTNRTKVINAFNTDSPLVSIHYIEKDCDFEAVSSINKLLVLNSSQINAKSSKASQGVNVLKSKNNSVVVEFKICEMDEDTKNYYRANIPAIGCFRKDILK